MFSKVNSLTAVAWESGRTRYGRAAKEQVLPLQNQALAESEAARDEHSIGDLGCKNAVTNAFERNIQPDLIFSICVVDWKCVRSQSSCLKVFPSTTEHEEYPALRIGSKKTAHWLRDIFAMLE